MANPHLAHIDTRLHRPTVMPESCAEEGGHPPGYGWRENQGDYIHDVPKPKKVPRVSDGERVAGVLLAVSIGLVGACALVAWWTT